MTNFLSGVRPAFAMIVLLTLLLCGAYPMLILGIGQGALPHQANGSLIVDGGKVVGSELIGQSFASDRYFNSRPSAAGKGYDAAASSGSNMGPTSQALNDRIVGDIKARRDQGMAGTLPADLVTASGSGLDPDLSPESARIQVPRVARARGLPEAKVAALVEDVVVLPALGLIGEPHVNVLMLNRALDRAAARP